MLKTMSLAAAAATVTASAATAQSCADHATIVNHLGTRWAESRQAIMLDANGGVVEIYAAENGTWTIILTQPGGPTCMIVAGTAFEMTQEPFPAPGEDM